MLLSDDLPDGSGGGKGEVNNITHPFVTQTYRCVDAFETKDTKNRPFKVAVDEKLDVLIKDPGGQCCNFWPFKSELWTVSFYLFYTKSMFVFPFARLVAGGEREQVFGMVSCSLPGAVGQCGWCGCWTPARRCVLLLASLAKPVKSQKSSPFST